MARDLYDRNQRARILSLNMLVTASAPVVAPLIGGQVLLWFDWRAIFLVLVGFGLVSLLAASTLPETLGTSRRNEVHPLAMVFGYFEFFRSVRYVGYIHALRFISVACSPLSPARPLSTLNISACRPSTTASCLA
jgi:DHA1 family bicyclomycin/chloramphenicol resistance-like MFS transporter